MPDAALIYRQAFVEALQPPLDLTVSQWADAERQLTRRSSSEPGQWRTDRVPFLREPMDLLSPREKRIRRVVLIFGSQSGAKTECGLNWLGRTIALDPAPFLVMFPTESFAKRQIRQRLTPLFTDTPAVAAKSLSSKSRDAANAMFLKEFQGDMLLSIIGGNSGSAAQGMPAQNFWADEVSSLPLEIDDKGDPLENAEARQTNFPDRKTLLTSTPGTRGACRITWEFETRSDRRRYAVLMPCCGAREIIEWSHMVWDTSDGEVFCQCPACGERVAQHHKTTMLAGGIWTPTAKGDGETAGFHLPGWYAPYGWLSWEKIRDEFLRAKGDPLLLKGWVNKRAAEAWEDESLAKVSAEGLMARVGGYEHGCCPAGALALVMAVDVQDSWLEVSVWGFGRGDEAWRIWHQQIDGDPGQDDVWEQVTTIRQIDWPREGGGSLRAQFCAVDTGGHFTGEAYDYCRRHARDGVVAIKGSSQRNAPVLGKPSQQDVSFRGRTIRNGITLYMIGTHTIKRTIYSRLKIDEPGPGYVNFDNATTEQYLQGLTCERLQPRYVKGFQVLEWVKPSGARNEPLDLLVYCLAMLELLKRRYNRATMWDQLAAQAAGPPPAPVVERKKGSWLSR
ncbi:MAG: phage terminase large subunit family protein [Candidatus Limnocylindrus sp.]